eukprot:PhF_6_TR29732/c0_g1_i1/m.43763
MSSQAEGAAAFLLNKNIMTAWTTQQLSFEATPHPTASTHVCIPQPDSGVQRDCVMKVKEEGDQIRRYLVSLFDPSGEAESQRLYHSLSANEKMIVTTMTMELLTKVTPVT